MRRIAQKPAGRNAKLMSAIRQLSARRMAAVMRQVKKLKRKWGTISVRKAWRSAMSDPMRE